jgi:hypothetical protein
VEAEEVRQLRMEIVHKAHKVRTYEQTIILPSDKPLTEPISPYITKLKRVRKK